MSRILVLPGIGDIYWVAVALRSFIAKHSLEDPEVSVWNFDGRPRSLEYVERIPFVNAGGYWDHTHKIAGFRQSYSHVSKAVWRRFHGWDYYLSANGALRHGRSLERIWTGYDLDWDLDLIETEAEQQAERDAVEEFGKYVVAFFSDHGMFPKWTKRWSAEACAGAADRIAEESGATVLLTGSEWDKPFSAEILKHSRSGAVVDLTGETSLDHFFGLINGASGSFGWCGGNLIHAVHTKTPTVIVWSRAQFPDARFHRNACRPDSWGQWYRTATVEDHTPARAVDSLLGMMR